MRAADVTTIKMVAWPTEHGASVMLGEALLAGLLISRSPQGLWPALGWVFLFLMSNSSKIFLKDFSHRIFTHRTTVAGYCCLAFGFLALISFMMTYAGGGPRFLWVLVGVIPLGALHFWAVIHEGKKEFTAEWSGALSLGAASASIILATGHGLVQAGVVWVVLAIRAMTSVVYVRAFLRQSRGQAQGWGLAILTHAIGLLILGLLAVLHWTSGMILIPGLLLILRFFIFKQSSLTAKGLGIREAIFGVLYVLVLVGIFKS